MAAGPGGLGICLKHDKQWKGQFQSYMNKISGPARRNPLISPSDIKRITKAVCTCSQEVNQKWNSITKDKLIEAHQKFQGHFLRGVSHDLSRQSLRELYEYFQSKNMFTGSGSADRLIFIFAAKEQCVASNILDDICPISRQQPQQSVHLGSLKTNHVGRFIGRGGTGIREAVHGIPVGNIDLNFVDMNNGNVDVRATYNCRPRNGRRIQAALNHRRQFYQGDVAIPQRFRERFIPNQVPVGTSQQDQGNSSDEAMET